MAHILVSGLVNTETTVRVRQFPIEYYPIDYPFFGVNTAVSGVGVNIAGALQTLGDRVTLHSLTGSDPAAALIRSELERRGIGTGNLRSCLGQTPASVVLYDGQGRRQIYCDLKDIQEAACEFDPAAVRQADIVVACNINFNRPLLELAKKMGKTVATDVHVLSDLRDAYNRDFLEAADILFLSDEAIGEDYRPFLLELGRTFGNRIVVLGRGAKGAAMYLAAGDRIVEQPAVTVGPVVNTVGAGDAVFSAFLHYYAAGFRPEEALLRAQIFASAKITVSGAAQGFITADQVEKLRGKL